MITKEALLEELQKLRLSRERPFTTKAKPKTKKKDDDLMNEALELLKQTEEEE